ncbi:hypothetical protein Vadar_014004 [Vaccinium darrowii]|uniref:Uncharacterized protein n=1 Tax=Vaccinium darrowii TaxID=229202 RepID=A0ACB7YLH1_9ERIC|nr:hypothetical protein Vadar_014004 [Vaccinium darrowii]
MTKRYKTLQKKLREFESSLSHLFSLNPAAVPSPLLSELSAEIAQQLVFLKKLLAAEISSHPSKPRHLAHISRHLDRLDSAFQHYRDHHDVNDSTVDGLDAASTCSCTESCLNDDGEGEGEGDMGSELCEEPEMFYEAAAAVEEEAVVLSRVESMTEKEGVEMGKEGDWVCGYFGVLGCGVVIGAVVMGVVMVRFSGCFQCIQHEGFLIPT